MKFEFLILPAIVASAPSLAEEYLTLAEAQALIFPGETLAPADFVLTDAQITALTQATGTPPARRQVKVWKVGSGGWFFLDQAVIRGDRIVFGVGLGNDGTVQGIEILTSVPLYDGVRSAGWRAQFSGRRYSKTDLRDTIRTVSGSTLSSNVIIASVQRVLTLHALFMTQDRQ